MYVIGQRARQVHPRQLAQLEEAEVPTPATPKAGAEPEQQEEQALPTRSSFLYSSLNKWVSSNVVVSQGK